MPDPRSLHKKWGRTDRRVALITGASRGIGREIALALAERGWAVVINYRSDQAAADDVLRIVQTGEGEGLLLRADISQAEGRRRMMTEVLQTFGRIDLLVNNAGMAPRQRMDILDVGEASYDEVLSVNLRGPFFLTQQVARTMIDLLASGVITDPRIINVGSISAYTSSPSRGEYCLSKAGLGMMTALFADRLAEYGIAVYEVRPGVIETDMTGSVKEKYDQMIADGFTPIQRWGQPDDVAKAVVAIAEGMFPFSTGEIFNVDGGFHLRRL
jgi:NAD(P)-dependent dehydrogenase (short-subunit alcohol dehydrogenase family)